MSMAAIWEFPPSSTPPHLRPKIDFRVHTPKLTQVVTGKHFHYFKIRLLDIDRFFTTKKSWNENYGPAQQIYSSSATSVALRSAIQAEHAVLYSGRSWRDGNEEGQMERNSTSFFELLDRYPDTKSHFSTFHSSIKASVDLILSRPMTPPEAVPIYTYVLSEDSLRFSRSGAGTTVDMSSKHALHAGATEDVFYAGEFWLEGEGSGKVLVMDNNSGTFAPPKKDLFRMRFLMQANFHGIQMEMLDYQDPEWKQRRKKE